MGRIAVDIGGTFTDAVWVDGEQVHTVKVPSITGQQDESVLAAIEALGVDLESVDDFIHGTTVALNTLLQRQGARLALFVTAGFRDVYEIGRANRPEMYNIHWRRPPMLLRRRDVFEIDERCTADRTILRELDEDSVRSTARALAATYDAVAICFLHAHVFPAHEQRVAEIVREEVPDVVAVCSHEIAPEWREYERWSTTLVSAYVTPVVAGYVSRLSKKLTDLGLTTPLHVMQSSGGVTSAAQAANRVVSTLFSGPVGGTVAAELIARQVDADRLVCVDIGGTSFDVSLVLDGVAETESEFEIAGHPILAPKVSVSSLGAGGGSIAYVESGGLRVGPESAGAYPGPACYGRGGMQPTVTDANLFLGRIPPTARLGGTVALDHAAAATAIAMVATELELEPVELAAGIISVTNAKMADAIREITIARGIDPRDFDLLAFGGAGPLHAAALAEELEIERVIVPAGPGTLSAWGMLQAPVRYDFVQPFLRSLHVLDIEELVRTVSDLRRRGEMVLGSEGAGSRQLRIESSADIRYHGQEYTLNIPLPEPLGADALAEVARRYEDAHRFRYGHANPSEAIELVSLRIAAASLAESVPASPLATLVPPDPAAFVQTVFDRVTHNTPVYMREALGSVTVLDGPCVVFEEGCTTLVPPSWCVATTRTGHLILQHRERH